MGSKVQVIPNGVSLQDFMAGKSSASETDNMTSADYYADSYGHFGIHGTTPPSPCFDIQRRCSKIRSGHCHIAMQFIRILIFLQTRLSWTLAVEPAF